MLPAHAEALPAAPAAAPGLSRTAPVRVKVDGVATTVDVGADDTALDLIRGRLGLTGPKLSCGHGACGACTVQLDGTPVVSCLLPATALHERAVTTVHGLPPGGAIVTRPVEFTADPAEVSQLHPVQRAFMGEDALQCGYCTPGFVTAAAAFHDQWRAGRFPGVPVPEPTRDEIAAALAGHLCRCGAYDGIFRAVAAACAGRYDAPRVQAPRVDAREKVTGAAIYTADVQLEGQLVGRIYRSSYAHGVVTRIDTSAARALPGVRAIHPMVSVGGKVRYAGQELVAVAAVDETSARAALAAIIVDLDPLPVLVDMASAQSTRSAPIYDRGDKPLVASEAPLLGGAFRGNVRGPTDDSIGLQPRQADAIVASPPSGATVVQGRWTTSAQCHTCMEPHAAVARWNGDGSLDLWASTQSVTGLAEDCAERWDLKPDRVHVHGGYVGGGFGSKAGFDPHFVAAVELARLAKAPVAVILDRAEELTVGGYRPPQWLDLAIVSDQGALQALTLSAYGDSGAAVGSSAGGIARMMYPLKERRLYDYDIVTTSPPGRPFRAPGGPPAFWAIETAVDTIAEKDGIDPIALRRAWDPNPLRQRLYTAAEALPWWKDRAKSGTATGRLRRGVGLAAATWWYFFQTNVEVEVSTRRDGLLVAVGAQDMGNGSRSVLREGVLRVFDVDPGCIEVRVGESADPVGPMSAGSRTTASVLPAATDGATQLAQVLTREYAAKRGLRNATPTRAGVQHDGGLIAWKDVLLLSPKRTAIGRRHPDAQAPFFPVPIGGLNAGKVLTGAVQVSEVEVDTWTGKVRVTRVWAGIAVGKLAVPAVARSQVMGGVIQGIGYALYEERRLDARNGVNLTAGMEDYRIPGIGDAPEIEVHFDEEGLEWVNGGGVGLAELCTVPVAASIGNAVHNATGWRAKDLPMRPDRVLQGVRA